MGEAWVALALRDKGGAMLRRRPCIAGGAGHGQQTAGGVKALGRGQVGMARGVACACTKWAQ